MIDSAASKYFPSGDTRWISANTTSQTSTITANQNIQAILVDNLTGGNTTWIRTGTASAGLFANATTAGGTTSSFPVYAGSRVIIGCGQDNASNQTLYVATVTSSGTANIIITPVI